MICDQDHFLNIWNQMKQYEQQLYHLVAPVKTAIIRLEKLRAQDQIWTGIDVRRKVTNSLTANTDEYVVTFEGNYYSHGETEGNSYELPLSYVLEGPEGVARFLEEKKAAEMAEYAARTSRRAKEERDGRYKIYLNLKNEFEPEHAKEIVKSSEANFITAPANDIGDNTDVPGSGMSA